MRFFYRVLSSIWYSRLSLQSSLNPQRTQVRAKGMKTIPSCSPSLLLRVKIIPSYHVTPAIGHCSRFHALTLSLKIAEPALEDRVFWRESELVTNHENSFAERVHVDVYKDFLWAILENASRLFRSRRIYGLQSCSNSLRYACVATLRRVAEKDSTLRIRSA